MPAGSRDVTWLRSTIKEGLSDGARPASGGMDRAGRIFLAGLSDGAIGRE
jgi:hypothetical protein